MTKKELKEIIKRHGKWTNREEDGVFADLSGANLEGAALNKYMYQIKVGGTYDTTTTYDAVNNQVIWEHWICDDGNTLENFEKMIEDVYGDNEEPPAKEIYQEYIGVINFFKAMKKLKD